MKPPRKRNNDAPTAGEAAPARGADAWPFVVRSGFTLHHKRKIYRGGEIVDLTEAEATARRHMIEPAPEQEAE